MAGSSASVGGVLEDQHEAVEWDAVESPRVEDVASSAAIALGGGTCAATSL